MKDLSELRKQYQQELQQATNAAQQARNVLARAEPLVIALSSKLALLDELEGPTESEKPVGN